MLGTGHSGRLAHKLSSRIIVKSSPAWAACLRVSGRLGIIGKLAHVACVAVGNATLDSTTLLNARLSDATADPATPRSLSPAPFRRLVNDPIFGSSPWT